MSLLVLFVFCFIKVPLGVCTRNGSVYEKSNTADRGRNAEDDEGGDVFLLSCRVACQGGCQNGGKTRERGQKYVKRNAHIRQTDRVSE